MVGNQHAVPLSPCNRQICLSTSIYSRLGMLKLDLRVRIFPWKSACQGMKNMWCFGGKKIVCLPKAGEVLFATGMVMQTLDIHGQDVASSRVGMEILAKLFSIHSMHSVRV